MQKIDLTGQRFGKLVVISEEEKRGEARMWKCKCDCGNDVVVMQRHLSSGHTKSCGCLRREAKIKHGENRTRLYRVWEQIRSRIYNPNCKHYKHYGGRGITMCDEWQDYSNFREWALATGYNVNAKHGECTIERIDVNGNYEPSNCCWVTQAQQMLNTRRSRVIEYNGLKMTVKEWADYLNMPYGRLTSRLNKLGWSIEDALCK